MEYLSFEIGNRIIEILNKRNEKGYKAMPKIGLAKGTLDNFKTSMPKADTLAKIADYLDVSVDYLLGRQVSTPELSENESILLSFFRECSENSQKILLDLAEHYSRQDVTAKEKEKISV